MHLKVQLPLPIIGLELYQLGVHAMEKNNHCSGSNLWRDDDAQTENTQILIIKYVILDVIMLDYQVKFNVD